MPRKLQLKGRLRTAVGVLWVLAATAVAFYLITDRSSELSGIAGVFSHLNYYFLLPAIVFESASMAAYVQLMRSTLAASGTDAGFWRVSAVFLASNSINNAVPGGTAFASVYLYRRFRDIGASEGVSGWTVVAANVLAGLSLLLLAFVGLVLSEGSVSGISLTGSLASIAVVFIAAIVVVARAEKFTALVGAFLGFLERKLDVSWKTTRKVIDIAQDIKVISPSASRLTRAFSWGMANWVFDATVLVIVYYATKSPVPYTGLLLAYSAGQLAANLPITPGGLGIVEGSISIALVAYGGNQEASIAAVLLYRFFSFWIWLLPGLGCYIGLRWKSRSKQPSQSSDGEPLVLESKDE